MPSQVCSAVPWSATSAMPFSGKHWYSHHHHHHQKQQQQFHPESSRPSSTAAAASVGETMRRSSEGVQHGRRLAVVLTRCCLWLSAIALLTSPANSLPVSQGDPQQPAAMFSNLTLPASISANTDDQRRQNVGDSTGDPQAIVGEVVNAGDGITLGAVLPRDFRKSGPLVYNTSDQTPAPGSNLLRLNGVVQDYTQVVIGDRGDEPRNGERGRSAQDNSTAHSGKGKEGTIGRDNTTDTPLRLSTAPLHVSKATGHAPSQGVVTDPPIRTSLSDEVVRVRDTPQAGRGTGLNSGDHLNQNTPPPAHQTSLPANQTLPIRRPAKEQCTLHKRPVLFRFKDGCVHLSTLKPTFSLEMQMCRGSCYSQADLVAAPVQYTIRIVADPRTGKKSSVLEETHSHRLRDFYQLRCKCCRPRSKRLRQTIYLYCKKNEIRSLDVYEAQSCGCKKCR